jgi:coatomer protein complex subunit alpha (xenin)
LAEEILVEAGMTDEDVPVVPTAGPSTLRPPPVITGQVEKTWPTKSLGESYFDKALAAGAVDGEASHANGYTEDPDAEQTWLSADEAMSGDEADEAGEDDGWGLDEDVLVPEEEPQGNVPVDEQVDLTTDVSPGVGEDEHWTRNSPLAIDHAAAGSFESAMQVSSSEGSITRGSETCD